MDVAIFWKTNECLRRSWVGKTREMSFILGRDMIDTASNSV
jgi:hypothetical protein